MLMDTLRGIRVRLVLASMAQRLLRWLMAAAVLACLLLIACKLLSWSLSGSALLALVAVTGTAALVTGLLRSPTMMQCALMVDRVLGCEERIATAAELIGSRRTGSDLARVQVSDAERRLVGTSTKKIFSPYWNSVAKQIATTALAFLFAGLLWTAPGAQEWRAVRNPDLQAAAHQEGLKLRAVTAAAEPAMATLSPEQKKLVEEARRVMEQLMQDRPDVRAAMRSLAQLKTRLHTEQSKMSLPSTARGALSGLSDQVDETMAALGGVSEMPAFLAEGTSPLTDFRREEGTAPGTSPHAARESISRVFEKPVDSQTTTSAHAPSADFYRMLERGDWPQQYDALIRKYFTD